MFPTESNENCGKYDFVKIRKNIVKMSFCKKYFYIFRLQSATLRSLKRKSYRLNYVCFTSFPYQFFGSTSCVLCRAFHNISRISTFYLFNLKNISKTTFWIKNEKQLKQMFLIFCLNLKTAPKRLFGLKMKNPKKISFSFFSNWKPAQKCVSF